MLGTRLTVEARRYSGSWGGLRTTPVPLHWETSHVESWDGSKQRGVGNTSRCLPHVGEPQNPWDEPYRKVGGLTWCHSGCWWGLGWVSCCGWVRVEGGWRQTKPLGWTSVSCRLPPGSRIRNSQMMLLSCPLPAGQGWSCQHLDTACHDMSHHLWHYACNNIHVMTHEATQS